MVRVYSRFSTARSESSADDVDLPDFDEKDPRALGRAMRKMAEEAGEPMPPEMDEMIQRLEAGEDPERLGEELEAESSDTSEDETLYDG